MNLTEISKEIEKLKYHISILGDIIDYHSYPVESLIILMDWDKKTLIIHMIYLKNMMKD